MAVDALALGHYEGVRALVLGATGFIGSWVVRELVAQRANVIVIARDIPAATDMARAIGADAEFHACDALETPRLAALVRRVRPHVTFNLVGYGIDPEERDDTRMRRLNAGLPTSLCEALAGARDPSWPGPVLVHAGTQLEYGPIRGTLSEERIPAPTTSYGRTKLEGTLRLARCMETRGMASVTARLFNVYGPGERPGRLLPSLIEAAAAGRGLPLTSGEQKLDFTYVGDVAEGLLRLGTARTRPGQSVLLASGRLTSVREFVLEAAAVLGIPSARLAFGSLPQRSATVGYDAVDTARLWALTGWRPSTPVRDGIRRTLEKSGLANIGDRTSG